MNVLDVALAMVFGALVAVYALQSAQAGAALRRAVARRDAARDQLAAAKAALAAESQRQSAERANFTTAVWSDFPCALRELAVAQVTRTCDVACRDDECSHATRVCERLVECDAVLVDGRPPAAHDGPLRTRTARLVRDAAGARARDASLAALRASRWFDELLAPHRERPRTYVVVSYGGSGSKMLAGWLSSLSKARFVARVYHLHDKAPPRELRELPPPRAAPSTQRDFRARRFPGGGAFRDDTALVSDLDAYRVLFVFKDPVEALVSRYGFGHCKHLQGDCGPSEAAFPSLDAYARRGRDAMGLLPFFRNYVEPSQPRGYPVLLLNYHKLWDNLDALTLALGLPARLAASFPERTETVRNDLTARAENNRAHSEATRHGLDAIYQPIIDHIRRLPAVSVA